MSKIRSTICDGPWMTLENARHWNLSGNSELPSKQQEKEERRNQASRVDKAQARKKEKVSSSFAFSVFFFLLYPLFYLKPPKPRHAGDPHREMLYDGSHLRIGRTVDLSRTLTFAAGPSVQAPLLSASGPFGDVDIFDLLEPRSQLYQNRSFSSFLRALCFNKLRKNEKDEQELKIKNTRLIR